MTTPHPKTTNGFLRQGTWWRNVRGEWLLVAEMPIEYRWHCARMLMSRARRYAFLEELSFAEHFGAPDDLAPALIRNEQAWMRTTALYRALTHDFPTGERKLAKLAERAGHHSSCPMRLRRRLRTEGATCTCRPKDAADVSA